jgi:hypothetical protein
MLRCKSWTPLSKKVGKVMELAFIANPITGGGYWAVLDKDGTALFVSPHYWPAQDKFDEIISDTE